MFVGRVIGEVWATRRAEALGGIRLLAIVPLSAGDTPMSEQAMVVAADQVGAGVGEQVVVAYGHAARNALGVGEDAAIEAAVVGIVDDPASAFAGGSTP